MNVLDIIIIVFLALLLILGIRKGLIISLASLVALVLGIYAAVHFSNYLDGILLEHLKPSRTWLPILSFTVTFLIVVILVLLLGKALDKMADAMGMGIFNRILGGLFGLLKGVFLLSILFFILNGFDRNSKLIPRETKSKSMFYGYVEKVFPELMKIFKAEIRFPETGGK
ncbi:MAG TPA: CvpA family protein [Bacteroidales bacterium]|nr:CvpA family protein [Bacteroidales bacterium]